MRALKRLTDIEKAVQTVEEELRVGKRGIEGVEKGGRVNRCLQHCKGIESAEDSEESTRDSNGLGGCPQWAGGWLKMGRHNKDNTSRVLGNIGNNNNNHRGGEEGAWEVNQQSGSLMSEKV